MVTSLNVARVKSICVQYVHYSRRNIEHEMIRRLLNDHAFFLIFIKQGHRVHAWLDRISLEYIDLFLALTSSAGQMKQ